MSENKKIDYIGSLTPNALISMLLERADEIEAISIACKYKPNTDGDTHAPHGYVGVFSDAPPEIALLLIHVLKTTFDHTYFADTRASREF